LEKRFLSQDEIQDGGEKVDISETLRKVMVLREKIGGNIIIIRRIVRLIICGFVGR
jgi:hypothetical protein